MTEDDKQEIAFAAERISQGLVDLFKYEHERIARSAISVGIEAALKLLVKKCESR